MNFFLNEQSFSFHFPDKITNDNHQMNEMNEDDQFDDDNIYPISINIVNIHPSMFKWNDDDHHLDQFHDFHP